MSIPITVAPITVDPVTFSSLNVDELTTNSLDGTGVFDRLMQTSKIYLDEEYKAGRITGKEYSTVYLGVLTAVLQESIVYILNHQSADKIAAEIGLIRQQTITELANTSDTLPANLGFNLTTAIEGIVAQQKEINTQKILESTEAVKLAQRNTVFTGQKIITELAQTSNSISTEAQVYALNDSAITAIEGVIQEQKNQLEANTKLANQKIVTELVNTSDYIPPGAGLNNLTTLEGLLAQQKDINVKKMDEIDKNIEILTRNEILEGQKIITELAQTSDIITTEALVYGLNDSASTNITGLLKSQKDKTEQEKILLAQQTVTELANTSNSIPLNTGLNTVTTIGGLVDQQKQLNTQKILESTENVEVATRNKVAIGQKIITEIAQTSDSIGTEAQTYALNAETDHLIHGIVQINKDRVKSEIDLTNQKVITELAQTGDELSSTALTYGLNADASLTIEGLIKAEKDKVAADIALTNSKVITEAKVQTKTDEEATLLAQKAVTELAQTSDTLTVGAPALNSSSTLTGLILRQGELYAAQTEGYARDAEQKLTKMMLDTWSVRRTQDASDTNVATAGILDSEINNVLNIAKQGIGAATYTPA